MKKIKKIPLTPSKEGKYCLGSGDFKDENGKLIECLCDECDYYLICFTFKRHDIPDKYAI